MPHVFKLGKGPEQCPRKRLTNIRQADQGDNRNTIEQGYYRPKDVDLLSKSQNCSHKNRHFFGGTCDQSHTATYEYDLINAGISAIITA